MSINPCVFHLMCPRLTVRGDEKLIFESSEAVSVVCPTLNGEGRGAYPGAFAFSVLRLLHVSSYNIHHVVS